MKRIRLLLANTILCSSFGSASVPALAADSVPQPAPDFHAVQTTPRPISGGGENDLRPQKRPTFTVNTQLSRPPLTGTVDRLEANPVHAESTPLNGQVTRLDAGQSGFLSGRAGALIQTPPVISGAVSQTVPPEMFRAWLDKSHPGFLLSVANAPARVLDVKGRWDDSSRTLRGLGIPYERIGSGELKDISLDNTKVLIIDCAGTVPKDSLQRIRDFVARGGYLLSTDWALDNMVEKAFPGYVEYDGKKNAIPIYDAYVVNPEPVLFANVVTNAHWKMDEASHLLRVLKPGSVRVLARSRKLERDDPGGQGVLAVIFPFGRGYVMHMVGHFDNNGFFKFTNSLPDPASAIGISLRQALASNFIVAGLSGTRIP